MREVLKFIGACFLIAVFIVLLHGALEFTRNINFVAGYNYGKSECREPGVINPEQYIDEAPLGSRHPDT